MRLEIDRWGKISVEDEGMLNDKSKCDPGTVEMHHDEEKKSISFTSEQKNMSATSYETKIVKVNNNRGGNRGGRRNNRYNNR